MTNEPLTPSDTVFITGVSGFIGSHVAHACADAGYRVVGVHRPHPTHTGPLPRLRKHDNVELRTGDLLEPSTLRAHLRATRPAAICHFGALTSVAYSFDHPQAVHATNATGTLALAEAARAEVPELKQFLFASSMEVYGNQTDGVPDEPPVYTEGMLPRPAAPYAAAKRGAECHLQVLAEAFGFPAVCIRQTNAYGRAFNDYFVVEAFVTAMLEAVREGRDTVNFGDPRPFRNFIHVDDLVALYLRLLETDVTDMAGGIYNTGPANAVQIRELAAMIRERTDYAGDINWYTRELRPGEVWSLNSNADKLHDAIGWRPEIGLAEGLDRVVDDWAEP